jgi:hypothetical protein
MNFEIPHHLQRQFATVISELQESVGWEGIISLLGRLSHTVNAHDSGIITW